MSVVTPFEPVLARTQRLNAAFVQTPCVVWLTGRPGVGKSAVARVVERELAALGRPLARLDENEGQETSARIVDLVRLLHDSGLIVIVAQTSYRREDRARAAASLPKGRFIEVFLDAPSGSLTGAPNDGYERPLSPALALRMDKISAEEASGYIIQAVVGREWRAA
jgi:bifunctional enzyme CysN/CysC